MTQSNIIDIDFLYFLLLVKVEVKPLILLFLVALRFRLTLTLALIVTLHKLDPASRSVLIFVDLEILRDLSLSFQLSDLIRKVFEDDITFFVLKLSQTAHD